MNNYIDKTDKELVKMYEEGDFQAFDILLDRHQEKVFTYIRFMVPDMDRANDIFQDTFVKAIVALRNGTYMETGQFSAWLMRIARNLVFDYLRGLHNPSRNVVSHELFDPCGEMFGDLFNDASLCEPNVETKMLVEQSYDDVRMMMCRLPDVQREVVYMRYFRDMSFKEIAQETGVSINTSLGRMRYALINLRRMAVHRNLYPIA